ncbi:MAG: hypothetical protein R2746_18440 [Acidimicrobiales bacterium]
MTRPRVLVVVAGTATEIGKTWVAAAHPRAPRAQGVAVAARKPAQSFDPEDPAPTDAEVLGAASGEDPSTVCPAHRCYEVALAPPMAADVLGRPAPMVDDLIDELRWPDPAVDLGWLETVAWPRSPIAEDADAVVLAELVEPDVWSWWPTPGSAPSTPCWCRWRRSPASAWWSLNRFDPADDLHVRNLRWLRDEASTS